MLFLFKSFYWLVSLLQGRGGGEGRGVGGANRGPHGEEGGGSWG